MKMSSVTLEDRLQQQSRLLAEVAKTVQERGFQPEELMRLSSIHSQLGQLVDSVTKQLGGELPKSGRMPSLGKLNNELGKKQGR
jgi:hypothetical protein